MVIELLETDQVDVSTSTLENICRNEKPKFKVQRITYDYKRIGMFLTRLGVFTMEQTGEGEASDSSGKHM
jgi:hypothetical protein